MKNTSQNYSRTNDSPNDNRFRMRVEQTPKRERILNAALKLFAHEPYQAVTMDRGAEAAGVAKGTLYLYFPSKDALYLGILSDGLDGAYRIQQSSADPKLPMIERMRRSIAVTVEFYDQRRDFLSFFATEEPRLAEARNRIIEAARERNFNFFPSLIEEGIRSRVFAPVDPRLATFAIMGSIRQLLLFFDPSRPVFALTRALGNLMLKALGANPASSFRSVHPN